MALPHVAAGLAVVGAGAYLLTKGKLRGGALDKALDLNDAARKQMSETGVSAIIEINPIEDQLGYSWGNDGAQIDPIYAQMINEFAEYMRVVSDAAVADMTFIFLQFKQIADPVISSKQVVECNGRSAPYYTLKNILAFYEATKMQGVILEMYSHYEKFNDSIKTMYDAYRKIVDDFETVTAQTTAFVNECGEAVRERLLASRASDGEAVRQLSAGNAAEASTDLMDVSIAIDKLDSKSYSALLESARSGNVTITFPLYLAYSECVRLNIIIANVNRMYEKAARFRQLDGSNIWHMTAAKLGLLWLVAWHFGFEISFFRVRKRWKSTSKAWTETTIPKNFNQTDERLNEIIKSFQNVDETDSLYETFLNEVAVYFEAAFSQGGDRSRTSVLDDTNKMNLIDSVLPNMLNAAVWGGSTGNYHGTFGTNRDSESYFYLQGNQRERSKAFVVYEGISASIARSISIGGTDGT